MKITHLLMLFSLMFLWAVPVSAQYTLYGAPEVVQLPPVQTNAWMQRAYPSTQAGPVLSPISPAYGAPSVPVTQPRQAQPEGSALQSEQGTQTGYQPNVVSSMLAESCGCNPLVGESCGGETCGPIYCEPCCRSPWFASAGFITMGRDKANRVWTTYNQDHQAWQLTNTDDIPMDWGYGGEIRFGRRFCGCGCQSWGIEAVYWSMKPVNGYISTSSSTGSHMVATPLDFFYTRMGGLTLDFSGRNFFDWAAEHRLWRRNEFHNVELNILRGACSPSIIPSWNVQWSVGVRYFRFDENLRFGSLQDGPHWGDPPHTWGEAGGIYEAYLDDHIKNSLVGVQFGFDARSDCWWNLQLYLSPKLGIYNNYIENTFSLYRGDGTNAVSVDENDEVLGRYPVHSTDNVFSVLAEVDMGLYWHVTQNWSAKIGYRLVAISNIGLADSQIIHYINDTPEISHIKHNGDMLLHGAFVGVTYNY